MPITKSEVDRNAFNVEHPLPYELRISDFESALQDVYLADVTVADFRWNARGELGTRTATLHRDGVEKLRAKWLYRV